MAVVVAAMLTAACEVPASVPVTTVELPATSTMDTTDRPMTEGWVGLVGCSMTVDAAQGYREVGGSALWAPAQLGYGRGTVRRWADTGDRLDFWSNFDAALARQPDTEAIWWELCTSGVAEDDLDHASIVMDELRRRVGDVPVYVSAQPAYTDGHVCDSAGPGGPEAMQALADSLIDTDQVSTGPRLAPLSRDQLSDGCHADEGGRAQMGRDLMSFFDENGS